MEPIIRIHNGHILRGDRWSQDELWVKAGKIVAPQSAATEDIDARGCYVVPGFIDLQLNGGFGNDFTSDPDCLDAVSSALPQYGVTAFLPTVITASSDQYRKVLPHLLPRKGPGAENLGIHLEGPFLSGNFPGAHRREYLQTAEKDPEAIYGSLDGVRMVTMAPELEGAMGLISKLKARAIVISAGHSNASFDVMERVTMTGSVKMVTHLFNAMRPMAHRDPGIVAATLTLPQLHFSIIADGIHLHPQIIKLAWQANPQGLILVTDAMAALGLPCGSYRLAGADVDVTDKGAYLKGTNTLAGSVCSMDRMIKNLKDASGCSLIDAVLAATAKPAKLLGLLNKGCLDVGCDADIVLIDEEVNVKACIVRGELVYENAGTSLTGN